MIKHVGEKGGEGEKGGGRVGGEGEEQIDILSSKKNLTNS